MRPSQNVDDLVSNRYDHLGRRVQKIAPEATHTYFYDARWQVIADIDENDNVLVSYTWADGIDNLLAVKIGSNSYLIRFALFNE